MHSCGKGSGNWDVFSGSVVFIPRVALNQSDDEVLWHSSNQLTIDVDDWNRAKWQRENLSQAFDRAYRLDNLEVLTLLIEAEQHVTHPNVVVHAGDFILK